MTKILSVKPLGEAESKSSQQREEEVLRQHEEEQARLALEAEKKKKEEEEENPQEIEVKDEDVLKFIEKKFNKKLTSVEELFAAQQETLPEDVDKFLKFKKETGRGLNDFMRIQKDYDSVDDEQILREYLMETEPDLDNNDIETMLSEYRYDEEADDESVVKKIKIDRKKAVKKAKNYFKEQIEKYKAPLESSVASMSDEEKQNFEAYKQSLSQAKANENDGKEKGAFFMKKTEELFNQDFKGFEFEIGGKKVVFKPGEANELMKNQSSPMNFIKKFLGEDGFMKDTVGYHKSLSMAMNPEKFANFFYEQGKADAADDFMKKTKNINMKESPARVELKSVNGLQVRIVNPDTAKTNGLTVRSSVKK